MEVFCFHRGCFGKEFTAGTALCFGSDKLIHILNDNN